MQTPFFYQIAPPSYMFQVSRQNQDHSLRHKGDACILQWSLEQTHMLSVLQVWSQVWLELRLSCMEEPGCWSTLHGWVHLHWQPCRAVGFREDWGCRGLCTYSCFISAGPTAVQLFNVHWLGFCLKKKLSFCFP